MNQQALPVTGQGDADCWMLIAGVEMAMRQNGEAGVAEEPEEEVAVYNSSTSRWEKRAKQQQRCRECLVETKAICGFVTTFAPNAELREGCNYAHEFLRLFLDHQFLDLVATQTIWCTRQDIKGWTNDRNQLMPMTSSCCLVMSDCYADGSTVKAPRRLQPAGQQLHVE